MSGSDPLGSVTDASAALARGGLTVAELVHEALDRAERAQRDLAAFASIDRRGAGAAARARGSERELAPHGPFGPLHGVPIVLKDNVAQAHHPNRAGSRVLPDVPEKRDSPVAARLAAAGAIVIGRTNMHELAWGGTTDNPHLGACRNPWDTQRVSAGSSGGTASAVADGVVPVGIGTDTGGSVRLPSAVTNLTGLRPTIGRVPTDGVVPLAWTLDTVGPMGRSAADCAAMFSIIAPSAPGRVPLLPTRLAGLRVGLLADYALVDLEDGVSAAMHGLLAALDGAGAITQDVRLPDLDLMVDALVVVDACEPSAIHARHRREHPELIGSDVRRLLEAGESFTAVEYLQAQRFRTHLSGHLRELWRTVDVLLTPTLPFTAPRIGEQIVRLGGREEDNLVANMRFTAIASLTGSPALSVPAGFDERGLPVGAQLIGPSGADEDLLDLGRELQRITDHHRRRPPGR